MDQNLELNRKGLEGQKNIQSPDIQANSTETVESTGSKVVSIRPSEALSEDLNTVTHVEAGKDTQSKSANDNVVEMPKPNTSQSMLVDLLEGRLPIEEMKVDDYNALVNEVNNLQDQDKAA